MRFTYDHNELGGAMPTDGPAVTRKCFACDQKATAGWMGKSGRVVEVCQPCAIDILPRLLVDAVHTAHVPTLFDQVIKPAKERFWYAVASRLSDEAERDDDLS